MLKSKYMYLQESTHFRMAGADAGREASEQKEGYPQE